MCYHPSGGRGDSGPWSSIKATNVGLTARAWVALAALLSISGAVPLQAQRFETQTPAGRWFKGNTHTHTINTDGDSPPDTVVSWYRARGYHFLAISDHDTITDPATLRRHVDANFILVAGEEVTGRYQGAPVHLTALNPKRIVKPFTGPTLLETLQSNVDGVRAAGGVPLINHPNFRWALNLQTLANVKSVALFELYNGHPRCTTMAARMLLPQKRCGTQCSPAASESTAWPPTMRTTGRVGETSR
jgi:hypothetical protein